MSPSANLRYFAYGSNMLSERLTASNRVPSATNPIRASLSGYRLRFNKLGSDTSAKCNIVETGSPDDIVHGVVYEMSADDLDNLDRVEGAIYARTDVDLDDGSRAFTYIATETRDDLVPWDWYCELVVAGATQHGLPAGYIDEIRATRSVADPIADRPGRRRALAALDAFRASRAP